MHSNLSKLGTFHSGTLYFSMLCLNNRSYSCVRIQSAKIHFEKLCIEVIYNAASRFLYLSHLYLLMNFILFYTIFSRLEWLNIFFYWWVNMNSRVNWEKSTIWHSSFEDLLLRFIWYMPRLVLHLIKSFICFLDNAEKYTSMKFVFGKICKEKNSFYYSLLLSRNR